MQGLEVFAATSGLEVNNSKSTFIQCGIPPDTVDQIADMSGFIEERLPFKYLGVPRSNAKLKAHDCERLVEKMTARIRGWGVRHLSFAARLQSVNGVLMSMHVYWSQILILPKVVIKQVNQICRSYLWHGNGSLRPVYVSWERVCWPKQMGGLGIRNLSLWNIAAIGKIAWTIHHQKENLWIAWVNHVYIRGKEWKSYVAPVSSSWVWKHICHAKDSIYNLLHCWDWLDRPAYKISKVYSDLIQTGQRVPWHHCVWNKFSMPKHKFCTWLAIQDRLPTSARLQKFDSNVPRACNICAGADESSTHLFGECHYTKACHKEICTCLGLHSKQQNPLRLCLWIRRAIKGKIFRKKVMVAAISATIYNIWRVKNYANKWDSKVLTIDHTVQKIKLDVKTSIKNIKSDSVKSSDKEWLYSL